MNKKAIVQAFLAHFSHERALIVQSAKTAHEAATHEESAAEDRHDTFAIEASYLAAGQAARVAELEKSIAEFEQYLTSSPVNGTQAPTATFGKLVTLEHENKKSVSFLSRYGGGAQITHEGMLVTLVTPQSPLGDSLFNSTAGEEISVETKNGSKEYTLLSVD